MHLGFKSFRVAAGVALGVAVVAAAAFAAATFEGRLLPDGDGQEYGSGTGLSAAISGDTLVLGAPDETSDYSGPSQDGVGYVFTRGSSGWTQQARLTWPTEIYGRRMGNASAIDGGTIVLGSLSSGVVGYVGGAEVFVRSGGTWSHQDSLVDPAGESSNSLFGAAVAVQGDTAFVGAPQDFGDYSSTGFYYDGAVRLFTRSGGTWTEAAQVLRGEETYALLGNCLAVAGGTLVVGARNGGFANVYVSDEDGVWTLQDRLEPPDGAFPGSFASSIALSDDTIAVGSPYEGPDGGYDSLQRGVVHVFTRSSGSWTHAQTLSASNASDYENMGYSVALDGDVLLAASPAGDSDRGVVHVFKRGSSGFAEDETLAPDARGDYAGFGRSVAMNGGTAVVGAPNDNFLAPAGSTGAGYVYLFETPDTTPPTITVSVSPSSLWPPNHQLVTITPTVTASDASGAPTVTLVGITSNEADNGLGDGDTANDRQYASDGRPRLRAERSAHGNGRTYTLTYRATDAAGNSATASATVTVPKNQSGH